MLFPTSKQRKSPKIFGIIPLDLARGKIFSLIGIKLLPFLLEIEYFEQDEKARYLLLA